jgi:hypothetical protein
MSLVDIISPPQLLKFDARDPTLRDETPFADSLIVTVDVTLSEEYDYSFEVSTNPVERGIDIADHKRRRATVLRMSGVVSDSPNNVLDVLAGNTAGIIGFDGATRSQDAYKKLLEIANQAEPILVVSRLGEFDNMTFTSFQIRKDDAGHYLGFTAVLEEVRFAEPLFGTFVAPAVEHTAPSADVAQTEPPTLPPDTSNLVDAAKAEAAAGITRSVVEHTGNATVDSFINFFINAKQGVTDVLKGTFSRTVAAGTPPVVP